MKNKYLRRYTHLPAVISMLATQRLALLEPDGWEDEADRAFVELYAKKKKKTVRVLCFTSSRPRFHHWKVFADGPAGVCVTFDYVALRQAVSSSKPSAKFLAASYKTIKAIGRSTPSLRSLLVLKRDGFRDEGEVRLVLEGSGHLTNPEYIQFPLSCIKEIALSPWLPKSLADDTKKVLRSISHPRKLKIYQSRLLRNDVWMKYGKQSAESVGKRRAQQ